MDANNVSVTNLYNRLVNAKKNPEQSGFSPVLEEILFKLSGDTSDKNVQSIANKILERKIEVANVYKKKKKKEFFEKELYVANSIIQYLFEKQYTLGINGEKIVLEKIV